MSLQLTSLEQTFFIERDPGKSGTFFITVRLFEEVDPLRLKKAAEIAAGFYPRLGEKPVLTGDGKLVMRPNRLPPPVFENTGRERFLGSDDTNGYLYEIQYSGQEITVTFSHSIFDAGAVVPYFGQLMYEYFRLSGEDIPDEGLVYTEKPPAEHLLSTGEAIDAYEKRCQTFAAADGENIDSSAPAGQAAEIYTEYPLFGTPYGYAADLTWDNGEFMRAVKELDATPFSFLSATIAHAICRAADTDGKVIRESYACSLRKLLQVPSQCNLAVSTELRYVPGRSVPETLRDIRARMDAAGTPEKLISAARTYDTYADMLINGLDMRDIVSITDKFRHLWSQAEAETFYFANLGVVRFPSRVQEKLASFSIMAYPQKKVTDFHSFVFNGTGTLRMIADAGDGRLPGYISDILREYGVVCTYREIGKFRVDRTDVLRFEREEQKNRSSSPLNCLGIE